MIVRSLKGIVRKEKIMNERENRFKYASETLEQRMNKKLTEDTSWYSSKKKRRRE